MSDWTVLETRPDPHRPNAFEIVLKNGGMTARVWATGRGSRAHLVVSFSSSSSPTNARAEAHRFTASVLDEMVDLEDETGLPCGAETTGPEPGRAFQHGMEWVGVTVIGRDACAVIQPFFGDALEDAFDGPGPGR